MYSYKINQKKDDSKQQESFIYNGSVVKLITVFDHKKNPTALIEDESGEIFPVPKNSLRLHS